MGGRGTEKSACRSCIRGCHTAHNQFGKSIRWESHSYRLGRYAQWQLHVAEFDDVAAARATWTTNSTAFYGSGAFSNAIPINSAEPARFFRSDSVNFTGTR